MPHMLFLAFVILVKLVQTQQNLFSDLSLATVPPTLSSHLCFPIIKHQYPPSLHLSLSLSLSLFPFHFPLSFLYLCCKNKETHEPVLSCDDHQPIIQGKALVR
ncbi:hypothetical protein Peur_027061 [Populus x canadensis]